MFKMTNIEAIKLIQSITCLDLPRVAWAIIFGGLLISSVAKDHGLIESTVRG